jgi:putative Holliday junction resolvase
MRDETLLAFDFGLQRIGVAVGEARLGQARALCRIDAESNAARFAAIERLIAEWRPARLLVGKPLHEDGAAHAMTARCARFAEQLRGRFRLPVEEVDERFSSLAADAALRATVTGCATDPASSPQAPSRQRRLSTPSWQARKARIDAEAARVILQAWLDDPAHHVAA